MFPIMYDYVRDTVIFQRNVAIAMGNSGGARPACGERAYSQAFANAATPGSMSSRAMAEKPIIRLLSGGSFSNQ